MKRARKMMCLFVSAVLLAGMMTIPALAASRKRISSVNLTVEAEIEPETKFGDESIDVTVRGGKYSFDYYDIENVGFEWSEEDVPEITIYLKAEDGYYFSLTTASAVKLSGATYVRATKQDSSETLKLTVKLPSLAESVGEQSEVTLTDNGYAIWDDVRGAGSYELRLYRNGNGIGASVLNSKNSYFNFQDMMTRAGSYYVKVRPVNRVNPEKKGAWRESMTITISADQAAAIRTGNAGGMPVRGTWAQDEKGWYYHHSDGSYTKNGWEEIKGQWYYFDENGYMKTGWIDWNGKRYYCAESGEMLKNTTTPDGFILDYDGAVKND